MVNEELINRQKLRDWDVCYDGGPLAELVPPEGVSLLAVLDATSVPIPDRIWVALHALPRREVQLWCCRIAARALRRAGVEDIRSWRAVWVVVQYHHGCATREQVIHAAHAAWSAYAAVYYAAGRHAAYAAVDYTTAATAAAPTTTAAYVASAAAYVASATAGDAYYAHTYDADTYDVERLLQLAELRELATRV